MCQVDKFGFLCLGKEAKPIKRSRLKNYFGFQTGDMVKAIVPTGKHAGTHVGKVTVRKSGAFDLTVGKVGLQSIRWKHCRVIDRFDGYIFASLSTKV